MILTTGRHRSGDAIGHMNDYSVQRRSLTGIEDYWRSRVQAAQARYQQLALTVEALQEDVEGSLAKSRVRRSMAWARHEVVRTLNIYVKLAARGEMPPPEDDARLMG